MKRIFKSMIYFVLAVITFTGCAMTKLADYQPKTPEEKDVYEFFMECNIAYHTENITKWMACFHDNAKVKIHKDDLAGQHWVGKQEYQYYLEEEGGSELMKLDILKPKFTLMENEATMTCFQKNLGGYANMPTKFKMVKKSDRWYINELEWGRP